MHESWFLTGGTGFLGSYLASRLLGAGARLHVLVYRPSIILGDRAHGYSSVFQTLYQWFHAIDLLRKQAVRRAGNDAIPDLDLRFPVDPESALAVIPVLKRFFEEYPYDGPEA